LSETMVFWLHNAEPAGSVQTRRIINVGLHPSQVNVSKTSFPTRYLKISPRWRLKPSSSGLRLAVSDVLYYNYYILIIGYTGGLGKKRLFIVFLKRPNFNIELWGCIQKFPDWPSGARTANCTASYH